MSLVAAVAATVVSASAAGTIDPATWNRAMVEVADLDSLSLSPDGRTLLFRVSRPSIATNRINLEWQILDVTTGHVRPVGSGGDAIIDDPGVLRAEKPLWLADGSSALVRQHVGGATGIWAYRIQSGKLEPLLVGDSDVENLRLSDDGLSALYELGPSRAEIRTAEERERDEGIHLSPRVDLAQSLFRGGTVEGRRATQRLTGYWYMRGGLLAASPRQTWRWDSRTGQDQAVGSPQSPKAFVPPSLTAVASLGSAATGLAEAQWDGSEGSLQWRTPIRAATRCAAPLCRRQRVSSLVWASPSRTMLVTFADRHHRQTLGLWDVRSNRLRVVLTSDGLMSGSRRGSQPCEVSERFAICVHASAASAPKLVKVDLAKGRTTTLYDPNGWLRAHYRPTSEPIALTMLDGRPLAGVLLENAGTGARAPLFINYYRCEGFLRGGEGDEWPLAALLDAGFRVACLNSVPFKGKQDALATYETGLAATRLLIDRLSREGRIDRRRVAMGGFSFGSEVAMWTAMRSDLLAAVSISSGQIEPTDYWYGALLGDAHDRVTREVWGLGRPEETQERWRQVSPALGAGAINAPILLQLPEQEARRIPELMVRLRQAGKAADFYAFPDEAHIKVEPRHRDAVFDRSFDWFTYWLLGRRDPVPAKVDRYRRWDALRRLRSGGASAPPAR